MNGRLEAQITVPVGGWSVSVNDGGGADVATMTAGTYYVTEFLAELKARMDAATGKTFTITCASGEAGTGKVTISINVGTFTLTWTSTDLRNALGFTGTLTPGAASFTSTNGAQAMWLPDCPYSGQMFDHQLVGHRVSDYRQSVSPTGEVYTLIGNHYRQHKSVRWTHVGRDRAIDGANSAVISWQQWVRQCQWGDLSYFTVGAPVRFYSDATNSTLLGAYNLVLNPSLELPKSLDQWTQLWAVEIPRLIEDT